MANKRVYEGVLDWLTNPETVFSSKLRYIVGFWLVEMAISTNQKPTIYRTLYENTGIFTPVRPNWPWCWVDWWRILMLTESGVRWEIIPTWWQVVPLDMKGFICHFTKWQIHPFISKSRQSVRISVLFSPLVRDHTTNLYKPRRPLEYERVYLPLCEVADTPFHIQGDDVCLFPAALADNECCAFESG